MKTGLEILEGMPNDIRQKAEANIINAMGLLGAEYLEFKKKEMYNNEPEFLMKGFAFYSSNEGSDYWHEYLDHLEEINKLTNN